VGRALKGVDAVCHLAAMVGVGQSMYDFEEYTSVNNVGTATLLQSLVEHPVERLIVASSMSIYGEGLYRAPDGRLCESVDRTLENLRAGDWDVRNAEGERLTPAPTPESKAPSLTSVYALSKFDQERMCLMLGRAYDIPTVALRFFNIYGPHQALSNPYTGVLAIFASRLLNGKPPVIFEDGLQQRDFVSVYDVARACRLALEVDGGAGQAINVGSGRPYAIRDLAVRFARMLGKEHIAPEITGKYRVGDIRNCFADITLAQKVLGYTARIGLEQGMADLTEWVDGQTACDHGTQAWKELVSRGLMV
jgi:dTDP-L-rhamnose 4-epimerase